MTAITEKESPGLKKHHQMTNMERTAPPNDKYGENRALVEYIGIFPDAHSHHGNAKACSGQYIRTQQEVVDQIKSAGVSQQPRSTYTNMVLDSSFDCLRDLNKFKTSNRPQSTTVETKDIPAKTQLMKFRPFCLSSMTFHLYRM